MSSNIIGEMLTFISMTALGYPVFDVILNLFQDLLYNGFCMTQEMLTFVSMTSLACPL